MLHGTRAREDGGEAKKQNEKREDPPPLPCKIEFTTHLNPGSNGMDR